MNWVAYGDSFLPSRDDSWKTWYWWRVIHSVKSRWEADEYRKAEDDGKPGSPKTGTLDSKLKGTAAELAIGDNALSKTGKARKMPKLKGRSGS